MRNVMIVDDESLVRIGLQSMIEWERYGYRIAGVFKNGEEALAAARSRPFDVALTDIRMPGLDGFALIRELKLLAPDLHVVVLSSYNDFEYTRQAIRLGVKDYISKYEMEPEELLRVLASLPFEPAGAAGSAAGDGAAAWREEARRLLEEPVQEGGAEAADCPLLAGRLRAGGAAFRWIELRPLPREAGYSSAERRAMLHLAEEMFARLRNPVLFGESGGALHGGYACGAAEETAEGREECRRMAEEWTAAFAQKLNVELAVGFGAPAAVDGSWTGTRREAAAAAEASLFGGRAARFGETLAGQRSFGEEEWLGLYKRIKQRIGFMQFGPLADDLVTLPGGDPDRRKPSEWIRLGVAAASLLADFVIERYDPEPAELRERFGPLWPFAEAAGAAQTAEQWARTLRSIASRVQELAAQRQAKGGWLERVKDHLAAHYAEPVRLEDMAQLANFSENHFSQRFRQETGVSFSDYLTDLRIREAVRLFRGTELSTEEIAERVGYANPNYFVKVFKRKTGQTVKHFKSTK